MEDARLVLLLRFDGEGWALRAEHGAEAVGPVPVPCTAVMSLASATADRRVAKLVRDAARQARSRLRERAAALRAELAEVESALDGLSD